MGYCILNNSALRLQKKVLTVRIRGASEIPNFKGFVVMPLVWDV